MHNRYPVRYPVGYHHRKHCVGAFQSDEEYNPTGECLDYIESRKKIYLPGYVELATAHSDFKELQRVLENENIMICEVDGPRSESMEYYVKNYAVDEDFIDKQSVEATKENLEILLDDPKHPFGHGYCLAWALQNFSLP